MTDNTTHESDGERAVETDGGVQTADYLNAEINMFKPATPFMRDHLKVIWGFFAIWALFVFGPVTAAAVAPEVMTETEVLGGYPLHFFLTALVAPAGALALSAAYAWQRDRLDEKYGISHEGEAESSGAMAADGGEQ
ncbi:DUF4212 domain-containing protein [Salinilacihabitans rarus]|uniref:DUF4212 domain-containing protein n=1 Tax=Salinilacihabitans rarus TaxID=2961596 RepID=UPI0020C8FA9A|nr:DUF4212 domain-containing protein [Salinilacihabitans rarus]